MEKISHTGYDMRVSFHFTTLLRNKILLWPLFKA
jgi:hypothetical protein